VRFVFRREGELSHAAKAFLKVARQSAAPTTSRVARMQRKDDQAFQPET
jgi:hypothetical protein